MTLRYDCKVAVITGGGAGLGRLYACFLAARGAKVVVNDFNQESAKKVVDEIVQNGGVAVSDSNNVLNGEKIIATALSNFGAIHILVNNAGILRDVSFSKQTPEQWDIVLKVHLWGTVATCKAAWKSMNEQGYGRILNITSVNGLYGQFGQTNYSAAKSGIVGFSKSLALEGAKANIKVNVLAPGAGTAMTLTVMPKNIVEAWKPDYVAPVAAFLVHESVPCSGSIFEAGGGWMAEVKFTRSPGVYFDLDKGFSPEDVQRQFSKARDFTGADFPDETAQDKNPFKNPQLKQVIKKLGIVDKKASKL